MNRYKKVMGAVALTVLVGGSIFYACTKNKEANVSDNVLKYND